MSDIKKELYKELILGLIKISPDFISNRLYLNNIHWITRIKKNKSQDIYIDLSTLSSELRKNHKRIFIKLLKRKLKYRKKNQRIILDFTNNYNVSYDFIKDSSEKLIADNIITKDILDNNIIIILASEKVKSIFLKYFEYYLLIKQ